MGAAGVAVEDCSRFATTCSDRSASTRTRAGSPASLWPITIITIIIIIAIIISSPAGRRSQPLAPRRAPPRRDATPREVAPARSPAALCHGCVAAWADLCPQFCELLRSVLQLLVRGLLENLHVPELGLGGVHRLRCLPRTRLAAAQERLREVQAPTWWRARALLA